MATHQIEPAASVAGSIHVPGDKAISHRALILAALAPGRSRVTGCSPAADVGSTLAALGQLGVATERSQSAVESYSKGDTPLGWEILVDSPGLTGLSTPESFLDCGNSGSTLRMLMGALAGSSVAATLDGDDSLRRRPVERVAGPLRRMGADITTSSDRPPVTVTGTRLHGADHTLQIASAQVKTAILLSGLSAEGRTTVREPAPSRDHTERMLQFLGIPIDLAPDYVGVSSINGFVVEEISVPGDLSSAAFLLVAAAILPGSVLELSGVGVNPTRAGILDALREFGARIEIVDEETKSNEPRATIRVSSGERRPLRVDGPKIPSMIDELPLIAVLGAMADGETVVRDAAELRVKESDRIATTVAALRGLGAEIDPTPDGFVVQGGRPLIGGHIESAGDHRIAMAGAVAALACTGPSVIEGWEAVAVSYPGFERDLQTIVRA